VDYFTASEGAQHVSSQGAHGDKRLSSSSGLREPTGLQHAIAVGGDETLCGIVMARLHRFPELEFLPTLDAACPECVAALSG
jgi:hypothetical protein